ncbi:hypothetical protein FRC96_04920 [Lujinxingia vulgaris]|uniref:Uncharacterized protein n=1 Tax=Lujinxingia vulgaris TaxID=2600176 RepID=A0A5C6X7F0_9DELT|nr:hypothetical protein [Lujinxingia vulgaris]TXD37224.1 hypothetical protein FRC98_10870 [Lujinxingia vulgaris]TXD40784.1 hypothetical protein FRC96_04920 [Lujinxingia vulgaris]
MSKIHIVDEVAYDRDKVYETFRDHMVELVPYLPDIQKIEVRDRQEIDASTLKVVNFWKANADEVPKLAQKFIKPEMLEWTDYATWHMDSFKVDWVMEVGFLSEAVTCKGTTSYVQKGEGRTEVVIDGELTVDAKKIPGVPRLGAGAIGSAVESFVVRLITPNLTQANRGLERYLADQ